MFKNSIYRDDVIVLSVGNFMVSGWTSLAIKILSFTRVLGRTNALTGMGKIFIRRNVKRQENSESNLLAVRQTLVLRFVDD